MILTKAIIEEAKSWLGCRENGANKGACLNELQELYNGKTVSNGNAWCAKFVWTIANEACKKLHVDNPLLKTESTAQMLDAAKGKEINGKKATKLRVDSEPGVGAVFYNKRDGGGHVGFVTYVSGGTFHTIEGNTEVANTEGVFEKSHTLTEKQFQFIHLEDLDTIEDNAKSVGIDAIDVATENTDAIVRIINNIFDWFAGETPQNTTDLTTNKVGGKSQEDETVKWVVLLAGLGVGGYFIYKKWG